jgi:hypothetical protein
MSIYAPNPTVQMATLAAVENTQGVPLSING